MPIGLANLLNRGRNTVTLPKPLQVDQGAGWIDDGTGGIYLDYQAYALYDQDEHLVQLPIANSRATQSAVIVQVAKPTWKLRVDWTAMKTGSAPKPPDFDIGSKDLRLARRIPETHHAKLDGNGDNARLRISGTYIYLATSEAPTEYVFPRPPFIDPKLLTKLKADSIKASGGSTSIKGGGNSSYAKVVNIKGSGS